VRISLEPVSLAALALAQRVASDRSRELETIAHLVNGFFTTSMLKLGMNNHKWSNSVDLYAAKTDY
jgi:hypothetical protein